MTKLSRILVTDAENRAALAVTRSLGRAGYQVAIAHHMHPTLASSSRYCTQRLYIPDVVRDPNGFANGVARAVLEHEIDAVIPVSEITTLTLARAVDDGILKYRLCTPAYDHLKLAADKRLTLELAQQLGVPVPHTIVIEHSNDPIGEINLSYPIVVKPARSRVWHDGKWFFNSVSYANSAVHLEQILGSLLPPQYPILLQERIEGPGVGIFACYDHGRPSALFSHKRIREKPPSGGVSVLRESVPIDPDAGRHTSAILGALHWHGVAMVEYKLDRRDQKLKLMEINGRLWGSLQLAIDAGVDFPRMIAQILLGEPVEPVESYKTGVRTRWLWGDVDAALSLLLKSRKALNLPPNHPGKWRTLLAFLLPWYPGLHYEVLSLSDFRPWLYETKLWFRNAVSGRL